MTDNTALWLSSKRAAFTVGAAPFPTAQSGEIVIRTRAIAVNPMDRLVQTSGDLMTPYLHYPAIVGSTSPARSSPLARMLRGFRSVTGSWVLPGAPTRHVTAPRRVLSRPTSSCLSI